MHVTAAQLEEYLRVFYVTLEADAQRHLPAEQHHQLWHLSLLPAKIRGFVSTRFGVAITYAPAPVTSFSAREGHERAEDFVVKAPLAIMRTGPLMPIAGRRMAFNECVFSGAFPFRLVSEGADATFRRVRVEVGAFRRMIHYAEVFGDRADVRWASCRAGSDAKDEVLAAMADVELARQRSLPMPEYLARFRERNVLLLGAYNETGTARLSLISRCLRDMSYHPVLVKDVDESPFDNLQHKVRTLANICRFVVIEDTEPSGHLREVELCQQQQRPVVLMRLGGHAASFMTVGDSVMNSLVREQSYDAGDPVPAVAAASKWAEDILARNRSEFAARYPWRAAGSADGPTAF